MLTLFDLFELVTAIGCLSACAIFGYHWIGWVGVIGGGIVGFLAGRVLGRVPYAISLKYLKRDLRRCDTATLRSRLAEQFSISHFIVVELLVRGEPIESFRECAFKLLNSQSSDERRFGENLVQIWPELRHPHSD
jgi:hypothetical protein